MLTLADFRDYIRTLEIGTNFSIGKIDARKDYSIGIYQRADYSTANVMLGRVTKTQVKYLSILIHWNKNAKETEENAWGLYESLLNASNVEINGNNIRYIDLRMPEPADIGTDDQGVYERVIWADIYYEEED